MIREETSLRLRLDAVEGALKAVTAERDALREEVAQLREEVTRHKNRAAYLAEGVDGMPPRHQSGRR